MEVRVPGSQPRQPSEPHGDPCIPFVYQGLSIISSHNHPQGDRYGACFSIPMHWPHGDWILDKVLRQPPEWGWAASAGQILVLLGCCVITPQGDRPQCGDFVSFERCHRWPRIAWPPLFKAPADVPIVQWGESKDQVSPPSGSISECGWASSGEGWEAVFRGGHHQT